MTQPFGLNDDPFASSELEPDEATLLLQARVASAGGNEKIILPDATCAEIYQLARGKRGGVFALAARAMRIAASQGATTIEPSHVHEAAAEAAQVAALQNEQAETARTVITAGDDIPDMPPAIGGGLMLPSEPSADLDPGQRDWVKRFIPSSVAPRGLGSAIGHPPTLHEVSPPRPVERKTEKPKAMKPAPVAAPTPAAATTRAQPAPATATATAEPQATDTPETDPTGVAPRRLSPETQARLTHS